MARLQRKKTPTEKTRKKESSTGAVDEAVSGDGGPEKQTRSSVSTAKPPVKGIKAKSAAAPVAGEPNFVQKSIQFLREVRVELKKVTWPNRKQTAASTLVVIILVFIIASFLGLVDFGLSKLVQVVLA